MRETKCNLFELLGSNDTKRLSSPGGKTGRLSRGNEPDFRGVFDSLREKSLDEEEMKDQLAQFTGTDQRLASDQRLESSSGPELKDTAHKLKQLKRKIEQNSGSEGRELGISEKELRFIKQEIEKLIEMISLKKGDEALNLNNLQSEELKMLKQILSLLDHRSGQENKPALTGRLSFAEGINAEEMKAFSAQELKLLKEILSAEKENSSTAKHDSKQIDSRQSGQSDRVNIRSNSRVVNTTGLAKGAREVKKESSAAGAKNTGLTHGPRKLDSSGQNNINGPEIANREISAEEKHSQVRAPGKLNLKEVIIQKADSESTKTVSTGKESAKPDNGAKTTGNSNLQSQLPEKKDSEFMPGVRDQKISLKTEAEPAGTEAGRAETTNSEAANKGDVKKESANMESVNRDAVKARNEKINTAIKTDQNTGLQNQTSEKNDAEHLMETKSRQRGLSTANAATTGSEDGKTKTADTINTKTQALSSDTTEVKQDNNQQKTNQPTKSEQKSRQQMPGSLEQKSSVEYGSSGKEVQERASILHKPAKLQQRNRAYSNEGFNQQLIRNLENRQTVREPVIQRSDQQGIIEQINEKLKFNLRSGRKMMQIKLEPEYLGKLNIYLKVEKEGLTVRFNVENTGVKSYLEQNLNGLRTNLLKDGINVGQIQVDTEQQSLDFQHRQDSDGYNQQHYNQEEQQDGNFDLNQMMTEEGLPSMVFNNEADSIIRPEQIYLKHTHGSLNLLA